MLLPQREIKDFHATHVRTRVPRRGGASRPEQARLLLLPTLKAYSQHLGLGLVLDDASTASEFFRAHLPCDRMIEVMREGHPRARPMNADDPVHPCREGGPRTNGSWWAADHAAASEQLRQAEAGEAPLGGTARKHLGLS